MMRNDNTHAESSVALKAKTFKAKIVSKVVDQAFSFIQRHGPAINQIVEMLIRNRWIIRMLIRAIMGADIGD